MNRDKLFNFSVNLVIILGLYLMAIGVYLPYSDIDVSTKDDISKYSLYFVGIVLTCIGISPVINNYFILRNLINKNKDKK